MIKKRNTPSKNEVLAVLKAHKTAMSQDELEKILKDKMDRVTIYRILYSFCDDGILHKVMSDEGKTYFALCHDCQQGHHHDSHFHFRCTSCNTIECLNATLSLNLPLNYVQKEVNLMVSGLCAKCLI